MSWMWPIYDPARSVVEMHNVKIVLGDFKSVPLRLTISETAEVVRRNLPGKFPASWYGSGSLLWFWTARSVKFLDPVHKHRCLRDCINPLAPNDVYISRTAQLTSRRCIWNIYSTNILTEYFKHAAYSPFFSLFKMPFISYCYLFLVPVIFTF